MAPPSQELEPPTNPGRFKAVAFCHSAPRTTFLYAFFIAAYVAWEATTGIHRYALTLDLLVGFLLALPLLLVPIDGLVSVPA
jgi:hypothetical protein